MLRFNCECCYECGWHTIRGSLKEKFAIEREHYAVCENAPKVTLVLADSLKCGKVHSYLPYCNCGNCTDYRETRIEAEYELNQTEKGGTGNS